MNRLKTILVGVDFSACSRTALRQAVRLARDNSARLHAFHCVDAGLISELSWVGNGQTISLARELVEEAQDRLQAELKKAGAPEGTQIHVECDVPVQCVKLLAEHIKPDLLVVGLTGASNSSGGAGMFATRCLRKLGTKVLLVSKRQTGPFRAVVACVDFSDHSREVVEQALRVAQRDRSRIYFVHVYYPPWERLGYRAESAAATFGYVQEHQRLLLEKLKAFTGPVSGVRAVHRVIAAPHRGHAIVQHAARLRSSLVLLGRRGLSDLKFVLLGSTAELLARELGRSMLVVPVPSPAAAVKSPDSSAARLKEFCAPQA